MAKRPDFVFDRPLSSLAREFDLRGAVVEIFLPKDLYREFLHLYNVSDVMERHMSAVLQDGEHQLVLEEGRRLGYRMPEASLLIDGLDELRTAIDTLEPFRVRACSGRRVSLTSDQAQGFLSLISIAYDVVHDVFDELRQSDYMKCLRHFRDVRHIPYAGETALNDVAAAYFSVCRVRKRYNHFVETVHRDHDRMIERRLENAASCFVPVLQVRDGRISMVPPAVR